MPHPDLAVVLRTRSHVEANIVHGLLEAHGIQSILVSDGPLSVFPLTVKGPGEIRLSVRVEEADEARRVIEAQRGDAGLGQLGRGGAGFEELEERLGYRFRDRDLLECALTHRSRANEDATGAVTDNESLEFLGDSVLGFVIADTLFRTFPQFDEGQKSKIKASLVSTVMLARLARRLGLGEYLVLGRGEEKTGGRRKQALLADGYEALIAAIYLDGGIDAARAFITSQFTPAIDDVREPTFPERDFKSFLQEFLQAQERPLPEYHVVAESGPDHRKLFQVEVRIGGEVVATASGRSKKDAEQQAAKLALDHLRRAPME
jgi:ribonuclease III